MIDVGDEVVALLDGGCDKRGRPYDRPKRGQIYRITGIYEMRYGLGCTLEGLDPRPYRGYFLFVKRQGQWYFRKLAKDLAPASAEDATINILEKLRERA